MRIPPGIGYTLAITGLYAVIYFVLDSLNFPVQKDELHFWPTSLYFSQPFPPGLEQFRNYSDLNTPLPFVLFGAIEHFSGLGIWAGRFFNGLVSLWCSLTLLAPRRAGVQKRFWCLVGLFLFPYYLGVSFYLYTDIIAAALCLAGVQQYAKDRLFSSAVCFCFAVSARQYSILFPLVFGVHELMTLRRGAALLSFTLPLFALLGWFWLWGGPGPAAEIQRQSIATAGLGNVIPANAGYSLAVLGVYFVVPEFLLFSGTRVHWKEIFKEWRFLLALTLLTAIFFGVFPPLGNLPPYPFKEMGFLDKGLRALMNDTFRILCLCGLATLTVWRFYRERFVGLMVFFQSALMFKAHVAWDKYALSLLVVLWWWKANYAENPGAETTRFFET